MGNSLICSDIWHKYRDISKLLYIIIWDNYEISRVVFMPYDPIQFLNSNFFPLLRKKVFLFV